MSASGVLDDFKPRFAAVVVDGISGPEVCTLFEGAAMGNDFAQVMHGEEIEIHFPSGTRGRSS